MGNYWHDIETQWYKAHRDSLASLEEISQRAHRWVAEFAQHPDFISRRPSASVVVQRLLVRRLGEELRGVELLTLKGHGFQAISAAANLFEQSHFLTFASASDEKAEKYRTWNDSTKAVATVKKIVDESGTERGWSKSRIDQEYEKYRFLCGFKHNNAMMHRILMLPAPQDPDLFMGKFALSDSIWLVVTAVNCLAFVTIGNESLSQFVDEANDLLHLVEKEYPSLTQDK